MQPTYQDFVEKYLGMEDVDLLELYVGQADLVHDAQQALLGELSRRNLDIRNAVATLRKERPRAWLDGNRVAVLNEPVIFPNYCVLCGTQPASTKIKFRRRVYIFPFVISVIVNMFAESFKIPFCADCGRKVRIARFMRNVWPWLLLLVIVLVLMAFLRLGRHQIAALDTGIALWMIGFVASWIVGRRYRNVVFITRNVDFVYYFRFKNSKFQEEFLTANL